jgi:hypothetical protein
MSECFAIINLSSGKAVSVLSNQFNFKSQKSNTSDEVNLSHFCEEDNQFWFWDGSTIRSKKYPNKVLDFHFYGWKQRGLGKVYLYDHHGKPNQRWKLVNGELILEYQKLRLTQKDGLKICCESSDAEKNQKWTLEVTSKRYVSFYSCARSLCAISC